MAAQITKKNIFLLPNMNSQIRQSTDVEDGEWKTYRGKERSKGLILKGLFQFRALCSLNTAKIR